MRCWAIIWYVKNFLLTTRKKNKSIMLLRMDTALLIFLALYQHWWNKPHVVPERLKQRVGLFHSGKKTELGGQVNGLQLCGELGSGTALRWERSVWRNQHYTPQTQAPHSPSHAVFREQWPWSLGAPLSEAAWRMCFQVKYLSINTHWFSLIISTGQTWFQRAYVIWKLYHLFVRYV